MIRRTRLLTALLVCLIGGVLGSSASTALAVNAYYANHYGPLYSGYDQPAFASLTGQVSGYFQDGWSAGTAYTAIWFVNASQVRISASASCAYAGCYIPQSWPGARPFGYPIVHNHGNASPSYFYGTVSY